MVTKTKKTRTFVLLFTALLLLVFTSSAVGATDPGVGEVFPFKRSSLDMTGILCRYQTVENEWKWATEFTLLERNQLIVQWISFEAGWEEMSISVALYDTVTNSTTGEITRYLSWATNQSALMSKGYLFFNLPDSANQRDLVVQRFMEDVNGTITWDRTVFELYHRTLPGIIALSVYPAEVLFMVLAAIAVTIITAGAGGLLAGKKTLEKTEWVPNVNTWVPFALLAFVFILVAVKDALLTLVIMFPPLALIIIALIEAGTYLSAKVGVTQRFRRKPVRNAMQGIILDEEKSYLALPMYDVYTYDFVDGDGIQREGYIPAALLNDAKEYQERLKGNHRRLIPTLRHRTTVKVTDKEGNTRDEEIIELEEDAWGLTAVDPNGTYEEIRIILEVLPTGTSYTINDQGVLEAVKRESRNTHVIAAPENFKDFYLALRDLTKFKEVKEENVYLKEQLRNLKMSYDMDVDREASSLFSKFTYYIKLNPDVVARFKSQMKEIAGIGGSQ